MEKEPRLLPFQEKLTVAARIDYPRASEIIVSFSEKWVLVGCFRRQSNWDVNVRLYVAAGPPSYERPRPDHFDGLSPEINRSLTTYRQYRLFEPRPYSIFSTIWDERSVVGQVLMADHFRLQLQPIGQAQIWAGKRYSVLWECYVNEAGRQGDTWETDLAQFWYAVEDNLNVDTIFTQSQEPTFQQVYPRFLEHLGYAPDPNFERWWSKSGE